MRAATPLSALPCLVFSFCYVRIANRARPPAADQSRRSLIESEGREIVRCEKLFGDQRLPTEE
jgi:hypothetical protein